MIGGPVLEVDVLACDGTRHRFILTPRLPGRRWAWSTGGLDVLSVRVFAGVAETPALAQCVPFGEHPILQRWDASPEEAALAMQHALRFAAVTAEQLLGKTQ